MDDYIWPDPDKNNSPAARMARGEELDDAVNAFNPVEQQDRTMPVILTLVAVLVIMGIIVSNFN